MLPKFLTKTKIVIFLLAFLILFSSVSKTVLAFSSPTMRGGYYFNFEHAVYKTEEMNLQSFVNETIKATVSSIITSIVGCWSCTEEERERFPGFIIATGYLIAGIYTSPPASGAQYLADLGRQLGVVQPAYAQEEGIGFSAMERIRPIWTAFRNISYVFFVLILVFMGFAIMFRVKINPQTVISLQSALPKIVLALILITFSYAIVGFMLDLMYVFLGLISNLFIGPGGIIETSLGLGTPLGAIRDLVKTLFPGNPVVAIFVASGLFFALATILSLIAVFFAGPISWLFAIIAIILILIALVRVGWTLLKAYAMIVVSLIFAPFQILVGTLPGSNAIGSWFRNLIANIAVLPAIYAMFFVGTYLILSGLQVVFENLGNFLFVIISALFPPVGGAITAALILRDFTAFWDFFSALILPFIGLMVILMAPKVSDMIKSFVAGKPFEYGTAIGEAVGPAITGAGFATTAGVGMGAERVGKRYAADTWQRKTIDTIAETMQKWTSRGFKS